MANSNKKAPRFRVDLVALARAIEASLPVDELDSYQEYIARLSARDYPGAQVIAKERIDRQLLVYSSPSSFRTVAQAYNFHTKITTSGDRRAEENAWAKFKTNERDCGVTNRRFSRFQREEHRFRHWMPETASFTDKVKARISAILGPLSRPVYESILENARFGPGMSQSSRDLFKVTAPYKLHDHPTVTEEAVLVWRDFLVGVNIPSFFRWDRIDGVLHRSERVEVVQGCRFTFVDKNVDEKRTIAIEPSVNVFLQLGVHAHFAKRLRHFGVDLSNQNRNRFLALTGSKSRFLATIDLSAASDRISTEVVRFLLPSDWFKLLDHLRSKFGRYRDSHFELEKFSSMGNGFTFALETIIFKAIVDCSVREDARFTAVYGDDIIVPTPSFNSTVRALRFFGFKVNLKKSFSTGPFRESCGMDALDGVDVRPVFPKSEYYTLPKLIELHNNLWLNFPELSRVIESWVPKRYLVYGPSYRKLLYFFSEDLEKLSATRKWNSSLQCWEYQTWSEVSRRFGFDNHYLLMASIYHGGSYSRGTPRRNSTKLVKRRSPV